MLVLIAALPDRNSRQSISINPRKLGSSAAGSRDSGCWFESNRKNHDAPSARLLWHRPAALCRSQVIFRVFFSILGSPVSANRHGRAKKWAVHSMSRRSVGAWVHACTLAADSKVQIAVSARVKSWFSPTIG